MKTITKYKLLIALLFLSTSFFSCSRETNSIGMLMMKIPAGEFEMGSERDREDADESPVHRVIISQPFRMSATEVTNKQYEEFDPDHRKLRGDHGFSKEDDEAVVFVSYYDAIDFCKWLSKKEGKLYRLPTEAEWEYACRASTTTDFYTGNDLPEIYHKSQVTYRDDVPVSMSVGTTPPNAFGLYDMHGNVEEWCLDWYGPYAGKPQEDPLYNNTRDGLFRVARGGSHNTPVKYLRSANRMAMLPEDKHWLTGFRVVEAKLPASSALPKPALTDENLISQSKYEWEKGASKPVFQKPVPYVIPPDSNSAVPFYSHNHQPAITWFPNGDLLAIWFSANQEHGREMTVLSSRLKPDKESWEKATEFFKVPDRNMTGASLFHDGEGTIFHMNGVEVSGDWKDLAMVMRTSTDNGATWSIPDLVAPEHQMKHQVIAGMIRTDQGWLIQACDAVPGPAGGTAIYISRDAGDTWENPALEAGITKFEKGKTGGLIAGIHAGIVELDDGSLLALGRNDNIPDENGTLKMPLSISKDMGETWSYYPSEFPPINSGQRLALLRLNEGPILLISFTHSPDKSENKGMLFKNIKGDVFRGYGMYVALSYDEGKTWPVKKLVTDGETRGLNGGAWTKEFTMDATHAEPKGYLAVTQTPDNMIHLLSSNLYYKFNLKWVEELNK